MATIISLMVWGILIWGVVTLFNKYINKGVKPKKKTGIFNKNTFNYVKEEDIDNFKIIYLKEVENNKPNSRKNSIYITLIFILLGLFSMAIPEVTFIFFFLAFLTSLNIFKNPFKTRNEESRKSALKILIKEKQISFYKKLPENMKIGENFGYREFDNKTDFEIKFEIYKIGANAMIHISKSKSSNTRIEHVSRNGKVYSDTEYSESISGDVVFITKQ
jgi:hypothetical protein